MWVIILQRWSPPGRDKSVVTATCNSAVGRASTIVRLRRAIIVVDREVEGPEAPKRWGNPISARNHVMKVPRF
jgi:hypothetical protein